MTLHLLMLPRTTTGVPKLHANAAVQHQVHACDTYFYASHAACRGLDSTHPNVPGEPQDGDVIGNCRWWGHRETQTAFRHVYNTQRLHVTVYLLDAQAQQSRAAKPWSLCPGSAQSIHYC